MEKPSKQSSNPSEAEELLLRIAEGRDLERSRLVEKHRRASSGQLDDSTALSANADLNVAPQPKLESASSSSAPSGPEASAREAKLSKLFAALEARDSTLTGEDREMAREFGF